MTVPTPDETLFVDLGEDARLFTRRVLGKLGAEATNAIAAKVKAGGRLEVRVAFDAEGGVGFALVLVHAAGPEEDVWRAPITR